MKLKITVPILMSSLVLGACSDPTDYDFERSLDTARTQTAANTGPGAVFDPANGLLPFPNALLFRDTVDGTLNIPVAEGDEENYGLPTVALNTLDGFSTTQPMSAAFGAELDPASVVLGENVFVFEVITDQATGLVTSVVDEVVLGQVAAVAQGSSLSIVPLAPLKESTDYMVLMTNGILGSNGIPVSPSISFRLAAGEIPLTGAGVAPLEPLRIAVNAMLSAAADRGVDRATVVQAWTTKTQSITPVMNAVRDASQAGGAIAMAPTGATTVDINPALRGLADVYNGTLDVPYYLTPPSGPNDVAGVTSFWRGQGGSFLTRFNPTPVATSVQTIPVLMTVPNVNSGQTVPDAGWPVAIFVHGITRDKSLMLAIADSMAQAGFAVIAIDQVMHGDRTFGIDLANETGEGEAGPDGIADSSGKHFYNPGQLLATRDNLRQSAADLLVLSASIANIPGLDATRKAVIGHSLGGTTATTFAALDDSLSSVSLGMPAAGLVSTTLASPAFGPAISEALAGNNLVAGTPDYISFVVAAQTVVDSGDPINFGAQLAAKHPVHMIEVVGDLVVPSRATQVFDVELPAGTLPGGALAGSAALAQVMGLTSVSADTNGSGLVVFTEGDHASLLSPESSGSLAATVEMQTQLATFAASAGTLIKITNPAVIQIAQ